MAKKQCSRGHIFDTVIYGEDCPFCPSQSSNSETIIGSGGGGVISDNNNSENIGDKTQIGIGEKTVIYGHSPEPIPAASKPDVQPIAMQAETVITPVNQKMNPQVVSKGKKISTSFVVAIVLVLALVGVCVVLYVNNRTGVELAAPPQVPVLQTTSTSATGRKIPDDVPDFVKEAIRSIPEDALVGIGQAKLASASQSMTFAQTRARASIARQINTMAQDMIRDYTAVSEVDISAAIEFQEHFTLALSTITFTGSSVAEIDEYPVGSGTYWAVVQVSKNNVANEINRAQAAAKLAVPAMLSFDAESRMTLAFDRVNAEGPQVVD